MRGRKKIKTIQINYKASHSKPQYITHKGKRISVEEQSKASDNN